MYQSQLQYLPLTPPFFLILVGLFVVLLILLQLGALNYAFMRLGLRPGAVCCFCSHAWSAATSTSRSPTSQGSKW